METMVLVAGLAAVVLICIAAALYFSIRRGGGKRLHPTGADRARAARRPAGGRSAGRRAAGSRRAGRPSAARRLGDPPEAAPRGQADPSRETRAEDEARPWRRVGFRKGTDIDRELWPAEAFGGVSDEQFWDDLAADRPLTTTARAAQQDPAARRRPLNGAPTVMQPVRGGAPKVAEATQPVRTATSAGQHASASGQPGQPASQTTQPAGQPAQSASQPAGQHARPASQPAHAARQPAGQAAGGRRRAGRSPEEDPLTSAAFSLREAGPVDGRSTRRRQDVAGDQYGAAPGGTGSRPGNSYDTPSPLPASSYRDPATAIQAMDTPPYGQDYGYGGPGPARQAADPRWRGYPAGGHPNGSGPAPGYQGGPYQGGPYQGGPYQGGTYQAGGYPGGSSPGGGRRGSGYPGMDRRGPYDPGEDHLR